MSDQQRTTHVRSSVNGGALCARIRPGDRLEDPLKGVYADCRECLKTEARMD